MDTKLLFLILFVVIYFYKKPVRDVEGNITDSLKRPFVFYTKRPFDVNEYIADGDKHYLIEPGYYYTVKDSMTVHVNGPVYFPANKINCVSIKCLIKK